MTDTGATVLRLADIPSSWEAPAGGYRKSTIRRALVDNVFGRRAFIKGVFAGGVALGLASLDLLPFGPRAAAEPGTYTSCQAWDPYKTNSYWNICNPCATGRPPRSAAYCNSNGYHRVDTVNEGGGVITEYFRRQTCGGINAWEWRISNNRDYPNPRDIRCSDGRFRTTHPGGVSEGPTVCMWNLPLTGTVNDNRTVVC